MEMYVQLEDMGYTQNQIDELDIIYHLKKLGHRKQIESKGGSSVKPNNPITEVDNLTFDVVMDSVSPNSKKKDGVKFS